METMEFIERIQFKDNFIDDIKWIQFKNRLKTVPRTGWLELGVPADKVESVYAHIASTKDLVSELNDYYLTLHLDIPKINKMLTIKELPKAYTQEEKSVISGNTSKDKNRNIILAIRDTFNLSSEIVDLYDEYEQGTSKEAVVALLASKFESDLQAVDYYEQGLITMDAVLKDIEFYPEDIKEEVKALLSKYPIPPLAWLTFDSKYYKGNEIFEELSNNLINTCINNYSLNNDSQKKLH